MSTAVAQLRGEKHLDRRAIGAFLAHALDEALEERALAVVRVPAPRASLDTPLAVLRKSISIAWRPPDGLAITGVGCAADIVLRGSERFSALEPASTALFARMLRRTHPDAVESAPRVFGGWAFNPSGADHPPWEAFGDARFVLPRWTYEHTGGGAVLTLALDLSDGWAGRIALAQAELSVLFDALAHPFHPEAEPPRIVRIESGSRSAHARLVQGITETLRKGRLHKAVASRQVRLQSERELDPWAILRRLSAGYPTTFCFGLRFPSSGTIEPVRCTSFIGATPELLFEKRGRILITEALAGSIAAKALDAEMLLIRSAKDRREHHPVVEHILSRLTPFSESIQTAPEPIVRQLPNVFHLHTPIRATLRPGVHASKLAEALHPTPAVGGFPSDEAVTYITTHEPHARGWYSGPIGWIDADGDAEFVVALRCGLVRGTSAWLYAGGGIVEGSTPDAEWDETELKFRPLLQALGVVK